MPKTQDETTDEITNTVMDIVREFFSLDINSDDDDLLYTKIHKAVRIEVGGGMARPNASGTKKQESTPE